MSFQTIPENDRRQVHVVASAQSVFTFDFEVYADTELSVYALESGEQDATQLALTTDYTVSINESTGKGSVTLVTARAVGDTIVITGDGPRERTDAFASNADLRSRSVNGQLNRLTVAVQELQTLGGRAMRLHPGDPDEPGAGLTLPRQSTWPGARLGWDANGKMIAVTNDITGVVASSFGASVAVLANAAALRSLIDVDLAGEPSNRADTVTTLSALDKPSVSGVVVDVSGFSSVDDGAAGRFRWDATATDSAVSGMIVEASEGGAGRWKRIYPDGTLTAKHFGADGGGTADDSAVITAIASWITNTGDTVFMPGSYNVDDATKALILAVDQAKITGVGHIVDSNDLGIPLGNDYQAVAIGAQRPAPNTDYSWLGIQARVHGVGSVALTENVRDYALRVHSTLIGGGEVWVDPINGSDSNSGLKNAPVQTVSYAVRTAAPSTVYLIGSDDPASPAIFRKFDFRATDTPGSKIKHIIALGHCRFEEDADDFGSQTWAANATYGNVYEYTKTTSIPLRAVLYDAFRDPRTGDAFRLRKYNSVLEVNNSGFGWYDDGTKIYIRMGSMDIDTIKSSLTGVFANAASRFLIYGTKLLITAGAGSSVVFRGVQMTPLYYPTTSARPYLYMQGHKGNIRFEYTHGHGVDGLGSTSYFQEVMCVASRQDNFHYTDSSSQPCYALEIDCESFDAGDFATYDTGAAGTDNGSAMHGSGTIARYGGIYWDNYGPNVVDSGTGSSWNLGVKAFGGQNASNGFAFFTTGPDMYLDTCEATGGDIGDLRADSGTVLRHFNTAFRTTSKQSATAEIETYDPMAA